MIFDVDDFHVENSGLEMLLELKAINPELKVTAFAVPAFCPDWFVKDLPDWIQLVAHGWDHGGADCARADEAKDWDYDQAMSVLLSVPESFVDGWKSPGWQISDGTYQALSDLNWWVADQHYNDDRRPEGLRYHCEGDGDHVHCHVQNVCGNGLQESFPRLEALIGNAESFEFVSEVVTCESLSAS